LTIKSTSHTIGNWTPPSPSITWDKRNNQPLCRRYFLLRLHTCVRQLGPSLPQSSGDRTKPSAVICMPVKYSIVKDRLILKNSGDRGHLSIR
jgi:hypothetical protein